MGFQQTWTDDAFRAAVSQSSSLVEISRRLGIRQGGPTNEVIRRHAARLGLTLPDDPRYRRMDLDGDIDKATQFIARYAPERLLKKYRGEKRNYP